MKKIFCGVVLYIFCNISYAALIEVTLGGTLVFNNRSYGSQFPCSTCSLAPIESNYTRTGNGDYHTITSTLSIPAGLVIAKIGDYSVSVSSNINVTSVSTCDSKPRIPSVFPAPCQSNNPINVAIPLTIDKGAVITHNTIIIRDTRQSWLNASWSVGSIQLTGDITASNITHASASPIRASLQTNIGNNINSSISINGPTATSLYGTATYYTGTATASTMDSKLIPTALDASFDEDIIIHNIEKKYIGSADKLNITSIYTFSDGNLCSGDDCMYTNENAKVNVQCPDKKATLEFKPASYVSGSHIGNLVGSWGNVNIDTTCAITVLIPYE
ncbi:hypothetical protein A7K77_03370 [Salmonella enterica]|nr:hypothetical protein [Salmonella enterica]